MNTLTIAILVVCATAAYASAFPPAAEHLPEPIEPAVKLSQGAESKHGDGGHNKGGDGHHHGGGEGHHHGGDHH